MKKPMEVEIQKGTIDPNPMTMKQMPHWMKVMEARQENALRRYGQTTDLHEPKTGRK